jgi:lysozyme
LLRARLLARRLRLFAACALLAALLGFTGWLLASHWRPRVTDFPVQGVDVSEEDGPIDWWQAKKAGVQFVYTRATRGAGQRDLRFAEHWRDSFEAGLQRGALHVYSLCQLASDQAGNFVSTVPRADDQLSPAILFDLEADCPARPERHVVLREVGQLVNAIETHLGRQAILKISAPFEAQYRLSEATDRALWSIQPFFPPYYMARPWRMWQASGFRRIEGAGKPLNWDVMAR